MPFLFGFYEDGGVAADIYAGKFEDVTQKYCVNFYKLGFLSCRGGSLYVIITNATKNGIYL